MVSLVVAMAENRVIGMGGKMPWHIPAELKHFKEYTTGKPVIMGRKTYESIGKVLPGRTNIIVSRQQDYFQEGALVVGSLKEAIKFGLKINDEICIIGGGEIFKESLDKADRIVLTTINITPDGDTYFPQLDDAQWEVNSQKDIPGEGNIPGFKVQILDKIQQNQIENEL